MKFLKEHKEAEEERNNLKDIPNPCWKLVPLEPNLSMITDDCATDPPELNAGFLNYETIRYVYKRLVEIAPQPERCEKISEVIKQAQNFSNNNTGRAKELVDNLLLIIYEMQLKNIP